MDGPIDAVATIDTRSPATDANGGRLTRARKEKEVDLVINAGDVIALLPHPDEGTKELYWLGLALSSHRLNFASEGATTKVTFRYLERMSQAKRAQYDAEAPELGVLYRVLKPTAKVAIAQLMPDVPGPIFLTRADPESPALQGPYRTDRARVYVQFREMMRARRTAERIAALDGLAPAPAVGGGEEATLTGDGGEPAARPNGVEEEEGRSSGGKRTRSVSPASAVDERQRKSARVDDGEAHVVLPSNPDRQQQPEQRQQLGQDDGEPIVID
ncbi:hypothetical protein AMAG_18145 [Allomyces macrogynus ATCC 38327]|uniref:Uncharacterized protein n=1 Tax=Allomyces macrogynus (strain ATCC 38327) TaxID=578462 RepID=A0A0L0SA83_ALLM3|nr:hypothetical protein AMAG_18145 [Allomyces macrogynus ATCC 38327]|eukprot:KNE59305.1 hypothetical protein AMAG_18145 [Allomyces macrogynus ATCC 38327]